MKNKLIILFSIIIAFSIIIINNCWKDGFSVKAGLNKDLTAIDEFRSIKLKKSIDVSKSTINYFDRESYDMTKFTPNEDSTPLTIVDYGPTKELPVEMKNPTIYVMFSHPIVPIGKLGEPVKDSPLMKIEPKINGVFRWYGTKLLSFEPTDKFTPQREYKVTISKDVKSLGGKKLEGKNEFSFHTEYIDIASFYPGSGSGEYEYEDVPLNEAKRITISFTYPVDLDVIKNYIKITSNGKNYSFKASRPQNTQGYPENYINRTIFLSVDDTFKENSSVNVNILAGAKSDSESISRPTEITKTFHTLTPFRYKNYDTYSYSFPRSDKPDINPVFLEFSHPIDEKSTKGCISLTPLKVDKIEDHIDIYGNTIRISNLPVQYDTIYYIIISKSLKDIYGRSLGKDQAVTIQVPPAESYYYFPNQGSRMLEASFTPKIIFEYQNIFDGDWKVKPIDDPYTPIASAELGPYDFSKLKENTKHFEVLDLRPWLNKSGKGFVGISWNFAQKEQSGLVKVRPSYAKEDLMLQVTDMGITTRIAYNKVLVYVNSLSTGDPVKNADVYLCKGHDSIQMSGKTNNEGLAVFKLNEKEYIDKFVTFKPYHQDVFRILVKNGDDKAEFVPNQSHNAYHFGLWATSNPEYIQNETHHTFIFTDRGLYKPGETVTFRGIDRNLYLGNYSIYQGGYNIEVYSNDNGSTPIYSTTGATTESGGFYGSFALPEEAEPGYYYIKYTRGSGNHTQSNSFQVALFRRLNFAISIDKPDIKYFTGDTVSLKVNANYLAGGALGGGDYDYYWTKNSSYYTPPGENWRNYKFGPEKYDSEKQLSSSKGKLNGLGEVIAKQTIEEGIKGLAYNYNCEVRVTDIDRQQVAGNASIIAHPASFYIGAKISSGDTGWWSPFVKKGDKFDIDYAIVKPEGEQYTSFTSRSKLNVKLYRVDWKITKQQGVYGRVNMNYERVEELESEKDLDLTKPTGKINLATKECGYYYIDIEAKDNDDRSALTRFSVYSTGAEWVRWQQEGNEDINLIADRSIYKVGDTVKLLVQSPLQKGKYLLTIEREGIYEEKILTLEGSANVIDIPVKDNYLPVFYIALSSFSKREKEPTKSYLEPDMGKPKGYFGITTIAVSTDPKELTIKIYPVKKSFAPAEEAEVVIEAARNGKPASDTEITFMAADRGVLDLINYHVQNPIEFFYSQANFPLAVLGADSRSLLIDPVTYEIKDLPGGDSDEGKMTRRKDFRPTAVFLPYLKTDKNGQVKVKFKLPDTLTTYRCTAVAVNKDLFGINENEIQVKNPINVRTALPRKLRVRDTSFAGVIVTNLDSKEHEVTVSCKIEKIENDPETIRIDGENKQTIKIPSNASVEIPFKLIALHSGEATLVFATISDILKEELEGKLVVETPIIKEAFTTIGKTRLDEKNTNLGSAQEAIIIPSNIAEGYGGLRVILDSTRLSSLSESINYLFDYPYGCIEQRTAKLLPLILFGDKISIFGLDSRVKDVRNTIEKELAYIAKFQLPDGGFGFWLEDSLTSSSYGTLKFAHALSFANKFGYKIPTNYNNAKLMNYLWSIVNNKDESDYCKLYSLYVLSLNGQNVILKLEEFYKKGDQLGISGYGFEALSYLQNNKKDRAAEILSRIKNFIKVGTQTIDLVETYENRYYFDSNTTNLAMLLMIYYKLDPKSEFVDRITNTLLKSQKYGHWGNTSDTIWALQALALVFQDEAGEKTSYTASVRINNMELINTKFAGVSKEPQVRFFNFNDSPINKLKKDIPFPFTFNKNGNGMLYYTTTIKYALPSEIVPARDEGLGVFTEIYDLDGKKLEGRNLKLGTTYKMHGIISSTKTRYYVALRLPIPSGAEILDASFVTTASYKEKGGNNNYSETRETAYGDEYTYNDNNESNNYYDYYYYSYGPVQKIMDNEVRYYFNEFNTGKQEVEFLFRVTTPGIYPTPPAYAECMYEEEVFGRNEGKLYIVLDE